MGGVADLPIWIDPEVVRLSALSEQIRLAAFAYPWSPVDPLLLKSLGHGNSVKASNSIPNMVTHLLKHKLLMRVCNGVSIRPCAKFERLAGAASGIEFAAAHKLNPSARESVSVLANDVFCHQWNFLPPPLFAQIGRAHV